mgnify:CR=1 FL=1
MKTIILKSGLVVTGEKMTPHKKIHLPHERIMQYIPHIIRVDGKNVVVRKDKKEAIVFKSTIRK